MPVFDFLKKKQEPGMEAPLSYGQEPSLERMERPSGTPTEQVLNFRKQGLSDNQIVQMLQRSGYEPAQIYDAMNQAEMLSQASPGAQIPQAQPMQMMQAGQVPSSQEDFEEMAESIIEQKWQTFSGQMQKLNDWKDKTETRLTKLEQGFMDLKSDVDNLHTAIVGKLGEYDKNLLNIGTEIKAMEKVFQKVLPTFTENINELTQVTRDLRKSK